MTNKQQQQMHLNDPNQPYYQRYTLPDDKLCQWSRRRLNDSDVVIVIVGDQSCDLLCRHGIHNNVKLKKTFESKCIFLSSIFVKYIQNPKTCNNTLKNNYLFLVIIKKKIYMFFHCQQYYSEYYLLQIKEQSNSSGP